MIAPPGRTWLLGVAREAIRARVEQSPAAPVPRPERSGLEVDATRGVFVTLRLEQKLRGCIGTFESNRPLHETVAEYAVRSAFADPRFAPVAAEELPRLRIELSVLSPLEPVADPRQVAVGSHGILIRGRGQHAGRQGCYLPGVALEHKMDRESFLTHCCTHKARLPPDAWRDPQTAELLVFTTESFEE